MEWKKQKSKEGLNYALLSAAGIITPTTRHMISRTESHFLAIGIHPFLIMASMQPHECEDTYSAVRRPHTA